jgi:hypothetical protein
LSTALRNAFAERVAALARGLGRERGARPERVSAQFNRAVFARRAKPDVAIQSSPSLDRVPPRLRRAVAMTMDEALSGALPTERGSPAVVPDAAQSETMRNYAITQLR